MTNEAIQTAVKDLKKKIFEFCNLNTMTDEQLEEKILLTEGSSLTFVRLTMLAGRMW